MTATPTPAPLLEDELKQLQDAIDRLRKYIVRRHAARGIDRNEIHGFDVGGASEATLQTDDIARLLAHSAELERDAFKYRWLRDSQESDWAICEWANDHDGRGFYRDARNADIVDAAIDAAIASEAKG